ncbi:MAG: hypothetical protein JRI23_05795 [Deltaproteobacteria bacterium]|jgi:hypothetical protein|nr:hypothetical protein [Deltaproteobacteria bacterium]MBW2531075.1 hypothetical protein [Deltaproteobacteria bacterium]
MGGSGQGGTSQGGTTATSSGGSSAGGSGGGAATSNEPSGFLPITERSFSSENEDGWGDQFDDDDWGLVDDSTASSATRAGAPVRARRSI